MNAQEAPSVENQGSSVSHCLFKCIKAILRARLHEATVFSDALYALGLASYCSAIETSPLPSCSAPQKAAKQKKVPKQKSSK